MTSSTEKGDKLEREVFNLFQKILSDGSYYLNDKTSKVFYKKGYYSSKRNKNIIIDISIETYLENASDYSILTLIECKNINKSVSVDDVEEFSHKINQIGEHNTKGIIITRIGFQQSAHNIACSEKIGLARITSDEKLDWISYRNTGKTNNSLDESEVLVGKTTLHPFISLYNGNLFYNIIDFLLQLSIIDRFIDKEEFIFIPFVDEKRICHIVERLCKYEIFEGYVLNFDKLTNLLKAKYNVSFVYDTLEDPRYLGKIEFNPLTIKISNKDKVNSNRWRFTLAHEIGHLILHSKLLTNRIKEKTDSEETLSIKYFNSQKNVSRMEFQANLFASALLLPDQLLIPQVLYLFNKYNIRRGRLYLDYQPINQHEVYEILYKLSEIFQVSVETIKIRLIKLNLLIDDTDKRLGTLIRNHLNK